jgi:hypothetical protein
MTGYDVSILNVGGEKDFIPPQQTLAWLVSSLNVHLTERNMHDVEIDRLTFVDEYLTTRAEAKIWNLVTRPAELLHVMTHAEGDGIAQMRGQIFFRDFAIESISETIDDGWGFPDFDCVLMDGCKTFTDSWFKGVANILKPEATAVYIGTTKDVNWQEATTYTTAFYLSFLQSQRPATRQDIRGAFKKAHTHATAFYTRVSGGMSPFRLKEITSNRFYED